MTDPAPETHLSPLRFAVYLVVAVVAGMLVALQSRINGGLGQALDDGFVAAIISFGSGAVLLSLLLLLWRPGRRGVVRTVSAIREGGIPWWYVLGGLGGAIFVLSQGLLVGILGVALLTVGIVSGQTLSSLLVDRRGLGTMRPKPITAPRLVGAVLALVAVGIAVSGELRAAVPLWIVIEPFLVGLLLGVQQALNGQVRSVSQSAVTATWANFVVGAAVLLVAALIHLPFAGWPTHWSTNPLLYLGGPVGMLFIGMQAAIVRQMGVLVMGLAVLAGQLATSVLLDVLLPLPGHVIAVTTVIGTVLTFVAVAVASVRFRASRATPAP